MKPFNGYEAKRQSTREILPAGGYIVKILDATEVTYDWGNVIEISFDVIEGQYKDFFRNDYKNNNSEDKKWRGKYRLNEPKDDGSEKDGWTKNTFNGAMYALENSNPGFRWDWNEKKLKGLTVGALYRNKEWEMKGNTGWTTECCSFIPAADIQEKKYKIPKDKPISKKSTSKATTGFEEISCTDDDLPF